MKDVKISLDSEKQQGVYANLIKIYHTKEEFVLDFLANYQETEVLSVRVVVNPHHLKRMGAALQESVTKYEEEFGSLTTAEAPKPPVGFSIG
ncbi:MAG: DUF3467 domain-containing protein [Candidatus Paceibacterota bacterium]